jgi:hypothetical protein
MPRPSSSSQSPLGSLALIAAIVAAGAGVFAYTAGWLSPHRLTPTKLVDAFAPPGGPALGHRRNHAKRICFTGVFESNGSGAAHLSHYAFYALMIAMPLIGWAMLSAGAHPVVLYGGLRLPAILPQSGAPHTLLWNAHF